MNKRQLFAGLVLAAAAIASMPAHALEEGAFDKAAFDAAQAANKPILLHINATWCETCQAQKKILEELEGDAAFKDYSIYSIDFDTQKDIMRDFGATSRSTLIVFKGKTEVGRTVADTQPASIKALLEKAL